MKAILLLGTILFLNAFAYAQNEQAPILEKEITYKDWTYKGIRDGENFNLRNYTEGKKVTMVVYFAPWCPNWRYDAPRLQRFYDQYKDKGLGIVAIGLYDPVETMKNSLELLKVTFPAVYESADRSAKQTSLHYSYRRSTGDVRGWGSPWYIFLLPSMMEKKGDVLTRKTFIINGEVIEKEGEAFIRKHLGLPADAKAGSVASNTIEVCDPDSQISGLKKPF